MTDLNGMNIFVAVAEAGSLTGAGKMLDLPKSTISRRLQSYEEAVGTTLFRRSTRSISLTDAGKKHFERVQALVHEASEAVLEIVDQTDHPAGLVRISASLAVGERILAPIVWKFLKEFPKVRVEMIITDEMVDLVADGIDFTIRVGDLPDSELMARHLGKTERILAVAPECLKQHRVPSKPQDLRRMPVIITTPSQQGFWRFENGEIVRVNWRVAAGTYAAAQDACLFGHGVALLPRVAVSHHLKSGRLVQLLADFPLPDVSINLVYPRLKHQSAAARAFHSALIQLETRFRKTTRVSDLAEV